MDPALASLSALVVALVLVCVGFIWNLQNRAMELEKLMDKVDRRIRDCRESYDVLRKCFMRVLTPIHQNTESIDELDDDLNRLQKLYEELKKRGEGTAPPPS